jgi:prefoldin subunit 2
MASTEVTAAPPSAPPAIQYREIMSECQRYMQKIAELEVDRNEHVLVEETLQPLDPSRRAYRLVGEILVERSVGEVLPSVSANKENVRSGREQLPNLRLHSLTLTSLSLTTRTMIVGKYH